MVISTGGYLPRQGASPNKVSAQVRGVCLRVVCLGGVWLGGGCLPSEVYTPLDPEADTLPL